MAEFKCLISDSVMPSVDYLMSKAEDLTFYILLHCILGRIIFYS